MKRRLKKSQKITKGTPAAVVISILIHAGLFLLAGMFVVFTVVKQKEVEFEPPKPVERPKMQLKKPKVRVKKSTKPKPTTRIVTKVQKASMPDIQLPEISGMAEGLGGGIGGFDLMPDLGEVSVFGSGQTVGNDLVGTFYDFKRNRQGKPLAVAMSREEYKAALMRFFRSGWKTSELSRYYQSPKKLYATTILIPTMLSTAAPAVFDEPDTGGWCWAVHYKGQLVHKDAITFRFWGQGDDVMLVRVNGKIVLNACWHDPRGPRTYEYFSPLWQSSSPDSWKYYMGNNTAIVGDWITLEAGVPQDMEVVIGEEPGGGYCAMLCVQVKGVEYPKNRQGGPILPIFKTAEPSRSLLDVIYKDLVPGEVCVTNGPVFCDYDTGVRSTATNNVAVSAQQQSLPESASKDGNSGMREWILPKGRTLKAQFVAVIGKTAVLRDSRGKQRRIPVALLSEEDREFVELARPPTFAIDFSRKTSSWTNPMSPYNSQIPPTRFDYVFSAKLKQTSAGTYNHELKVEYFAIGKEHDGDKYILLDRNEGTFVPGKENNRAFRFSGKKVEIYTRELDGVVRGTDYYGYLVVVVDERGKIIQHAASNEWLYEHLDNLRKLPVGAYMDKACTRTFPTSPKPTRY